MEDNIGEVGIASIRINGMRIQQLPIAEKALSLAQMPEVQRKKKELDIERVLKKYPSASVEYLESRERECRENIRRVEQMIVDQQTMIKDYTGWVQIMEVREQSLELASKIENEEERNLEIRKIEKKWPPYQSGALLDQIQQCREAVERGQKVIAEENASIAMLNENMGLAKLRDKELSGLGVAIER